VEKDWGLCGAEKRREKKETGGLTTIGGKDWERDREVYITPIGHIRWDHELQE